MATASLIWRETNTPHWPRHHAAMSRQSAGAVISQLPNEAFELAVTKQPGRVGMPEL